MDLEALERTLKGGVSLLLLCATVILGGFVVPFLLSMWVRSEKGSKEEVRELLTKQVKREGQLTEALVHAREAIRSASSSIDANTKVLQTIIGVDPGSGVGPIPFAEDDDAQAQGFN